MKNKPVLKTNLCISLVLIIGFILTAILSYQANYQASLNNIEQVSTLTIEGVYHQLSSAFSKPVNISLTMAHDSLLVDHLSQEKDHLSDLEYIDTIRNYLETYRIKYDFDSVFLVSTATSRYYNFNGLDRVLTEDNPENTWYYNLLDSRDEYALNVDNDEAAGTHNEIAVFINCKVRDASGTLLGIVGIGIRIEHLEELLQRYEDAYHLEISLVNGSGMIELSTSHNGYESHDWFELNQQEAFREDILSFHNSDSNFTAWTGTGGAEREKSFIVSRYIPELSWNLIVRQNTGLLISEMKTQFNCTCLILIAVIIIVLVIITSVIRKFNRQIIALTEERQAIFREATEQLYDNIYEVNVTQNQAVGQRSKDYFSSLGAGNLPFSEALHVVAEKQIKEEYRAGYIETFSPENIIREFETGNQHLRYDFMMTQNGKDYFWMRIDAHIFYSQEDHCIHFFTYRKNIDKEKRQAQKALTDEMTGLYTKKTTEHLISKIMQEQPQQNYAFFILDIDNFKQANDQFGHAFGDFCIQHFAQILKNKFNNTGIIGRIGGDEFAAFIPFSEPAQCEAAAKELSAALNTVCRQNAASWQMSASIGIALFPQDGTSFYALYTNADAVLYHTKKNGKNGFTFYQNIP